MQLPPVDVFASFVAEMRRLHVREAFGVVLAEPPPLRVEPEVLTPEQLRLADEAERASLDAILFHSAGA